MNEKLSMQDLGRLSSDEFKASEKNKIILAPCMHVLSNICKQQEQVGTKRKIEQT